MVREHARSTAALDLAAAFWEQQSAKDEPALRGLVILLFSLDLFVRTQVRSVHKRRHEGGQLV